MNKNNTWISALCFVIAFSISGCATTSEEGPNGWVKGAICIGGGLIGNYAAKELAAMYFKKTKSTYTAKQKEDFTKAFQLGLFITFCELANYAGNTIYKKLSEKGQQERKNQVLNAASTAQVTRYSDPSNPNLQGVIKPSTPYVETADNRECIDMEDTLADANSSETIYVKYCKALPNGQYRPVTV